MKIKMVECEQFAGLQDREVEFEPGLNLLIGENESGKSTMVDLIYLLLFKNVKIDMRGKDTEFVDKYFPKKANGPDGDVIDGVLRFETENGKYRLAKEWIKGTGSCKLTTPDGTIIKSADEINSILAKELGYNAGVYSEVVFASQRRQQKVIECILQDLAAKKGNSEIGVLRDELVGVVTKAVMETGGVSLDKLEKKLSATLLEYSSNWDIETDGPKTDKKGIKRGINNPWQKEVGRILAAYYVKERLAADQYNAEAAEKAVEKYKAEIQKATTSKKLAQERRNSFLQFRTVLGQISMLEKSISIGKKTLCEQENALEKWPKLEEDIKLAGELKSMQEQAKARELFNLVSGLRKDYEEKCKVLDGLVNVDTTDVKSVQKLLNQQSKLESKLAGLNLVAKIKRLSDIEIEVRSAATGEKIELNDELFSIKEAATIVVPGVMEMQLMPQGIDIDEVKLELSKLGGQIQAIYDKYLVKGLDELQSKSEEYAVALNVVKAAKDKLDMALDDMSWEDINKANADVPDDIMSVSEVKKRITDLCGSKTIDAFIGGLEAVKAQLEEKYISYDDLKVSIGQLQFEIENNERKLEAMDEVPDEYKSVDDPDEFDKELEEAVNDIDDIIVTLGDGLRESERLLSEKSAEEYAEELTVAEASFEEEKLKYSHWKHIYDVFMDMKETSKENPMEDIANKFGEYLSLISEGGVSLDTINEQLNARILSGKNVLTYETLSEGTKDTISLAFRLAYLSHLYPDGGGLAVFDDPFTDMDPVRVGQACKLIQKYAEDNQVIFVTCDDKYRDLLKGNVIDIKK